MGWLFLLFTVVPVVELWLLIRIGSALGAFPTVALVIITGLVGAALARREGLRVMRQWQQTLAQGQLPQEGLTGAALVALGGVLLVAPGVITDAVGLLLLVPPTRRWIAARLRARVERAMGAGTIRMTQGWGPTDFVSRPGGSPGEREVRGEAQVRPLDRREPPSGSGTGSGEPG